MSWNFPGAGGGGGSGLPAGYEVEVAAAGDLATALAANDSVYVSGNITISAKITISGNKRILFADGVVVTSANALLGNEAFSIPTGTSLSFDCPGSYTLLSQASHTGGILKAASGGTGFFHGTGRMLVDLTAAATCDLSMNLLGYIEDLEMTYGNFAPYSFSGNSGSENMLKIDYLTLIGGGTSCSLNLSFMRVDTIQLLGLWSIYSAGFMVINYATRLASVSLNLFAAGQMSGAIGLYLSSRSQLGSIITDSNYQVYVMARSNSIVTGSVGTNVYIAVNDEAGSGNNIVGPGTFTGYDSVAPHLGTSNGYSFMGCGFGFGSSVTIDNLTQSRFIGGHSTAAAIELAATCDDNDFVAHEIKGTLTITSGAANNRFTNTRFATAFTVTSGAKSVFNSCYMVGALTVSSGAASTFIGCILGTVTNNDGLASKFIGCLNVDGTPHHANNDGRIVYDSTATTGNVKTELFIDASALRLTVASDQSYLCNLRLISQRDQQDIAVFQFLGATIHNDGGTTTILNGTASSSPDASVGTGSTLTLHIEADNTNDALAVFVTANAGENWSHKLTVDLVEITN